MSKILIIDDEIEICKQVSLILSKNGFDTKYVTSYKELNSIINEGFDFDLVLVDLWIKNSSKQGIDIIQELKSLFYKFINYFKVVMQTLIMLLSLLKLEQMTL